MSRSLLKSALLATALAPLFASGADARDPNDPANYNAGDQSLTYGQTLNGTPYDGSYYGYNYSPAYPPIQASLYPCPKAGVPLEVGRTMITNPALAPHEMLYPHEYRALYPPYYYKNKCGLSCLPFFPKPPLKGTEVTVKYSSCHGLFGWQPPISRVCYSNKQWR
jgi:hypothetical protein